MLIFPPLNDSTGVSALQVGIQGKVADKFLTTRYDGNGSRVPENEVVFGRNLAERRSSARSCEYSALAYSD